MMSRTVAFLAWFLFVASGPLWLPDYRGTASDHGALLVPYAVIAVVGAIAIKDQLPSPRAALVAALPAIGVLGVSAAMGLLINADSGEDRGEPILLYYGVALWGSWGALIVSSAGLLRTRWSGLAGIALTVAVTLLALGLFCARMD